VEGTPVPSVLTSLDPLVAALRADGYTVVGPTRQGDAIVLDELSSAAGLPAGWGVETEAGRYRLVRRADKAVFGHSVGPQSWKRFLHPPRVKLFSIRSGPAGPTPEETDIDQDEPRFPAGTRFAFLGVRSCDLRAIAVQDRILGVGREYAERRRAVFIIAVNCTEPSATCFCVSAGGGPGADAGFDLALTEITDPGSDAGTGTRPDSPRYVAQAGSDRGRALLAQLDPPAADPALVARARHEVDAAATKMVRSLPTVDIRALLAESLDSPRWNDVAERCLACGNCTMACPTCFCTSVQDTTDLTGEHASRWQEWASCFEVDYSYVHGGAVRQTIHSRYRQWLTHKLGTWHDQFGESGCVGCGRCIAWCPVGIDITAETQALAHDAEAAL
jgi:ferredoxin